MKSSIESGVKLLCLACLMVAAPALVSFAAAQDMRYDRDIFVFGGVMTEGTFPGLSNIPLAAPLEDNYIVGAAVNYGLYDTRYFKIGAEFGLAGRFGDGTSAEVWAGVSARHNGFMIGRTKVSLGMVFGLSAVTDAIGIERTRAAAAGGGSPVVYYLGPEISLVFEGRPNTEFIFRTHHRSGGRNVPLLPAFGGMGDVSNANVFGIRRRF